MWNGSDCAWPAEKRCLVFLSDGGEDAVTSREFDLPSHTFVKNGFTLPKAKVRTAWQGQDTLLIATEWKPGELTASGYPFIVKRLARGQSLSDAREIFRGEANDGGYGVSPLTIGDANGHRIILIERPISTFESEKYIVRTNDVARTSLPLKSGVVGMLNGRAIVLLSQPWAEHTLRLPRRVRIRRRRTRPVASGADAHLPAGPARIDRWRRRHADAGADQHAPQRERCRARGDPR